MALMLANNECFIHIPKCGGASVWESFKPGMANFVQYQEEQKGIQRHELRKTHEKIKEIQHLIKPLRWLVQVRNPLTRFLSGYNYLINTFYGQGERFPQIDTEDLEYANNLTFEAYINCLTDEEARIDLFMWFDRIRGKIRSLSDVTLAFERQISWYEYAEAPVAIFKLENKSLEQYFIDLGYIHIMQEKKTSVPLITVNELNDEQRQAIRNYFIKDYVALGY
jgi:hypothetical protein